MRLLSRLLIPLGLLGAVMAAFAFLQLDSAALLSRDGLTQMAAYASGFMTPDLSANHLRAIAHGTLETLAMSAIGTLLAALLGLLLALPAAGRFGLLAQAASRLLLNALRAIPELVGGTDGARRRPGPNAGTLALALHTAGVLGRLFAEALENTRRSPPTPCAWPGGGRRSATAPCRLCGRSWWPTRCIAGRTISAWPVCSASSAPVASARCSESQPVPGSSGLDGDPRHAGDGAGGGQPERLARQRWVRG